jgi:hypothetical protein
MTHDKQDERSFRPYYGLSKRQVDVVGIVTQVRIRSSKHFQKVRATLF